MKTRDMVLCALFTALMCVGAFIKIPIGAVPITLQSMFAVAAGLILGKKGAISCALYALLGLIGIPVFASGGGIGYVLNPTFGYIIGFIAAAYVAGALRGKTPRFWRYFAVSIAALLLLYAFGVAYFYAVKTFYSGANVNAYTLFVSCFLLFLPGDAVTCALGAAIAARVVKAVR